MLEHGGRLRVAARRFGIPLSDWVDLSTGINPQPYPVPPLAPEVWLRLPETDDGLEAAAARYYGNPLLLPDQFFTDLWQGRNPGYIIGHIMLTDS